MPDGMEWDGWNKMLCMIDTQCDTLGWLNWTLSAHKGWTALRHHWLLGWLQSGGEMSKEDLRLRVNRTDGRTDEHVQHGKGALLYKELQPEAMAPREEFVGFWDTLKYIPTYPGRNLGTLWSQGIYVPTLQLIRCIAYCLA